ncbi:MAG: GMC family oxidoreductase [Bryobacteraceae bacterium]
MPTLANAWKDRSKSYDFIVIGSGYGGAITAARIATAGLEPKPSVCILERGKEWPVGTFPDRIENATQEFRSDLNPLGLYEILNHRDISVVKGSGLGGTSLINANVAIVPDREIFERAEWPRSLKYDELLPFYVQARQTLDAGRHPRAAALAKVQALDQRAAQLGLKADPLNIAVNFKEFPNGKNPHGVEQKPCIDCGDCVSGCNVGAKNTLAMNFLPMARNAGAHIFTQTKVEWIEKLNGGGWRIHGKHYEGPHNSKKFKLDARNVILAAGSVNSTEILLRSEMHGLQVSPALGTRFSGNGNFFGLAYNSDVVTNVLGYGTRRTPGQGEALQPGPTIVSAIRYTNLPADRRIAVEDLSFPSAAVAGAQAVFPLLGGVDTDLGDEDAERQRVKRDALPGDQYRSDGALNHTMFYLVTGPDDARGTIVFEAPWFERDGRIKIEWDNAGRQVLFTRINEELRRHARALGGSFVSSPLWNIMDLRRLITVHPLGGCPMGEDYLHGAVDEFGRVFAQDGNVHEGLFVADGAIVPSATGVNPFLTISALAERIAQRKIEQMQGNEYPEPQVQVSFAGFDPVELSKASESELERIFRRTPSLGIDSMMNGGGTTIDTGSKIVRNDEYWKGFFPRGHILNAMSSAIFTGFKKEFHKEGKRYVGITSDTDGRIRARNELEEVELKQAKGTLEAGKYILLNYLDPPWQGYYDIIKQINEDLLIGRVYLGQYPNGIRVFTFPMTRTYGFDQMTVTDHQSVYASGSVPSNDDLAGVWRMDVISNANHAGSAAYLKFDLKPDGRLESRYQFMGLVEGLLISNITQDHFQLNDFTPFHDEIRKIDGDFMVGKWVTGLPPGIATVLGSGSLGIFHVEKDGQFGFYYTLTRTDRKEFPTNTLLRPFLDVQLPDGLGMTFDEEMVGWFAEGASEPTSVKPSTAVDCSFNVRMTIRDLNEFIDGWEHEAALKGTISFGSLAGEGPVTFPVDERSSRFNYLRINPATREAEMCYRIDFRTPRGAEYTFEGRKFMRKDDAGGLTGIRELLYDYTTLFCRVYERQGDTLGKQIGTAFVKFRTFEDIAATANLAGFLRSFKVTGSDNPVLQLQGQMRFLAFTGQFVQQEYDPLSPDLGRLAQDVHAEVLRGAEIPDYFSTRPTADLHAILREAPTLPIESLVNTGSVRVDFDKKRIFRDAFWKGSFAKDTLLGWEERIRGRGLSQNAEKMGAIFAGGSFWKRFDRVEAGVATGHVVNYEISLLPGDPVVETVAYPDDNRRYFKKGDQILLLKYRNDPYKIVYDTIKVIDAENALGVMHLGEFPNGIEFSAFVMARNNYPFEKMSVEDHNLIFSDPRTSVPSAEQLQGEWDGHLVFLTRPNTSLLNQANPVSFRLSFNRAGSQVEGRYRLGLLSGGMEVQFTDEFVRLIDFTVFHDEIRLIDQDTLIGKWVSPELDPLLLRGLDNYLEPVGNRFGFYYILKRAQAGVATGGGR